MDDPTLIHDYKARRRDTTVDFVDLVDPPVEDPIRESKASFTDRDTEPVYRGEHHVGPLLDWLA
jgi:hypothetical protein